MVFKWNPFKTVILTLAILSLSSCISRLGRPNISGVIVDYDKNPVAGCQVGESTTAKDGSFSLKEIRYNKFLLSEMLVMEAPPLRVEEKIEKEGFEPDEIFIWSTFGGGQRKGAKYQMDTVYLRKKQQQFDVPSLLKRHNWELSFTKNADTVYMIREGFHPWCKTSRCNGIYQEYLTRRDDTKILPEGMISREIGVKFDAAHGANIQQVQFYKHTFDGPNKDPDTLKTQMVWTMKDDNHMQLKASKLSALNKSYRLAQIDLFSLMLIKED
jgi:hypothetical protein